MSELNIGRKNLELIEAAQRGRAMRALVTMIVVGVLICGIAIGLWAIA